MGRQRNSSRSIWVVSLKPRVLWGPDRRRPCRASGFPPVQCTSPGLARRGGAAGSVAVHKGFRFSGVVTSRHPHGAAAGLPSRAGAKRQKPRCVQRASSPLGGRERQSKGKEAFETPGTADQCDSDNLPLDLPEESARPYITDCHLCIN